jgi:AbiV family abortive infection protein
MKNKKLDRFIGKLAPAQIAQGINAAINNARRLVSDAELLFKNKRYASATGLAILAIEEAGKVSILRELSVAQTGEDLHDNWKAYRTHTRKNTMWILRDLVLSGARNLEDLRPMFEEDADHPYILDNIKQISFYTDCLGRAHWSIPIDIINEEITKEILAISRALLSKKEATEKEIELWKKYLGPVWKKDMRLMKQGLAQWAMEMWRNDLLSCDLEEFLEFINSETHWKH